MIELSLAYVQTFAGAQRVPFWFTGDKSIYINEQMPSIQIDLDKVNFDNLHQIYTSLIGGDLTVGDIGQRNELFVAYQKATGTFVDPSEQEVTIEEQVKEDKEIKEEDKDPVKELLSGTYIEVIEKVKSFTNLQLLHDALTIEKKRKNKRTSVISALEKQIDEVERTSTKFEVVDTDEKQIIVDFNNGTIEEVK